jgi:hypothetical protein
VWAVAKAGGCHQSEGVGTPLVDVDDIGRLLSQVTPKPPDRHRVDRATECQAKKRNAGFGTGCFEVTSRTAPNPHLVTPTMQTLRCCQHLYGRPGRESILFQEMENAERFGHDGSIRIAVPAGGRERL